MNSIVLWVGGLAATALGVIFIDLSWGAPFLASGYTLVFLAFSLTLGGHNDE